MSEKTDFLNKLIKQRIFPGISLLKGNFKTGEECSLAAGKLEYSHKSVEVNGDTIYDVASLTKPLITSLFTLKLIDDGVLNFSSKVSRILPLTDINCTIKELLTHSSGLPSWFPFYIYPTELLETIKNHLKPETSSPKVLYSCPNYILLKLIIEKVCSTPFNSLIEKEIFEALELKNSTLGKPEPHKLKNTAPTEKGNFWEREMAKKLNTPAAETFKWRENLIKGEVHDVNSFYFGGTAGNSGLFSNVKDIKALLMQFVPNQSTLLKESSILSASRPLFMNRSTAFTININRDGSCGPSLSNKAAGHTGFTGTSIWLDYQSMDYYIILTNRINPSVQNINFSDTRRAIHSYLGNLKKR